MRHGVAGRKLGRNTSHRKALFRNLANAVLLSEQVTTTLAKAKSVRSQVERLITLGKTDTLHSRRLAFDRTRDRDVVVKLFSTLSERYGKREGGYTRLLKKSAVRRGDSAEMCVLELVDHPVLDRKKKPDAPAESNADGTDATVDAAATGADPFSKLRKSFQGKRAKSDKKASGPDAGAKKGGRAVKKTASRSS
jgi:large subunit ribosomal protein L17